MLISQLGFIVSAIYLIVSVAAAYRNPGPIRVLSGVAAALFLVPCGLYIANSDVLVQLAFSLLAVCPLLVAAILVHPRRLIESRPNS